MSQPNSSPTIYRFEVPVDDQWHDIPGCSTPLHADCRAAVVLSGYDSPLYADLYGGWHRYEQQTMTGNAKAAKGRTEVLWSNRPLGDRLPLWTEQTL